MNYLKHISILLASCIFYSYPNSVCFSQPHTEWVQRYNSPGNFNEDLIDMVLDKEGNIYLTGNTGDPSDVITLKYSSNGNLLWTNIYNGSSNRDDEAVKIAVDDSGFVYVAGKTFNPLEFTNYLVIKYSTTGELLWSNEFNFGDSTTDVPHDMVIDSSSNIFLTGYGSICLECTSDFMTIKSNTNGILQWVKFYHGKGYFSNLGWTLTLDKSHRIIVSGRSRDITNGAITATVIYDLNGNKLEVIKYDSSYVNKVATDLHNNIYLGGYRRKNVVQNIDDIFINKYDSIGNLQWSQLYDSHNSIMNHNDYLTDMKIDYNNRYIYVTGNSDFNGQPGWEYLLLKYDLNNGDSIWKKGYSPIANSSSSSINMIIDKFDNIYITGSTDYNTPFNRILTAKYDSSGNFIWAANYPTLPFFNHYGKRVAIDSSNSVYVGGTSYGPESVSNDIVLIKYSQITQVQNISNLIPEKIILFQNYPNPFNPITNINYQLTKIGDIKVRIFSILGKQVAVLVNEKQNPGVYNIKWDASNFSSGMYLYNLEINGNILDTKKLILIK